MVDELDKEDRSRVAEIEAEKERFAVRLHAWLGAFDRLVDQDLVITPPGPCGALGPDE